MAGVAGRGTDLDELGCRRLGDGAGSGPVGARAAGQLPADGPPRALRRVARLDRPVRDHPRLPRVRPRVGRPAGPGPLGTFSPAVAALASRRQLDWEALAGWCSFGFFPGDRTQFTDVRVLPPATHTRFAADGSIAARERWWRWWYEPDRRRSYDDTVVELADRLAAVLGAELDQAGEGGLAVPISGGLDSRSTVAALTTAGADPHPGLWSFSYGWSDRSVETSIAAELAAARRLPFERTTIGPYLWGELDRVVDATEGMSDVLPPRQVGVIDEVAAHAGHVVAAHWGDVWLDDVHRDPARGLVDDVVYRMSKPGRAWLVDELCRPHLPAGTSVDGLLRADVEAGLREVAHVEDEQHRVKAFKTDHWSHRWTVPSLRTYRCGVIPLLPFYDPDLADLVATVPSAWMAGRRLQLDVIRRTAPDLAAGHLAGHRRGPVRRRPPPVGPVARKGPAVGRPADAPGPHAVAELGGPVRTALRGRAAAPPPGRGRVGGGRPRRRRPGGGTARPAGGGPQWRQRLYRLDAADPGRVAGTAWLSAAGAPGSCWSCPPSRRRARPSWPPSSPGCWAGAGTSTWPAPPARPRSGSGTRSWPPTPRCRSRVHVVARHVPAWRGALRRDRRHWWGRCGPIGPPPAGTCSTTGDRWPDGSGAWCSTLTSSPCEPDVVHFEFGSLAPRRLHLADTCGCLLTTSFRGFDLNDVDRDDPHHYDATWPALARVHLLGEYLWRRAQERGCPPDAAHDLIITGGGPGPLLAPRAAGGRGGHAEPPAADPVGRPGGVDEGL